MSKFVILDAGHGGLDSGACGFGYKESDIVLELVHMISKRLESAGVKTALTRTDDTFISLNDRAVFDNSRNADAFISVHCNSYNGTAKGLEVFGYTIEGSNSNKLAHAVYNSIADAGLYNALRGVKDGSWLYVVRKTKSPAILIETAFIDQCEDIELLKNKKADFADAITKGICNYLGVNYSKTVVTGSNIRGGANNELLPNGFIGAVTVDTDTLNIRAGRGTDSAVIGQLSRGTTVQALYTLNGWASIDYGSDVGFIYTKYVNKA